MKIGRRLRRDLRDGTAIAVVWRVEDVKEIRPDLTDEQCRDVLGECEDNHDATVGINWGVVEEHADALFPLGEGSQDEEDGALR